MSNYYELITPESELRQQIAENEAQLWHLRSLLRSERLAQGLLGGFILVLSLGFILLLLVLVHPAGYLLVRPEVYWLSGSLCVFIGFTVVLLGRQFVIAHIRIADLQNLAIQQESALTYAKADLELDEGERKRPPEGNRHG